MPNNQLSVMFGSGRPWVIYRQACTKVIYYKYICSRIHGNENPCRIQLNDFISKILDDWWIGWFTKVTMEIAWKTKFTHLILWCSQHTSRTFICDQILEAFSKTTKKPDDILELVLFEFLIRLCDAFTDHVFFPPQISTVSKGDVIKVVEDISFLQRIQGNHGVWLEEMKKVWEIFLTLETNYYEKGQIFGLMFHKGWLGYVNFNVILEIPWYM